MTSPKSKDQQSLALEVDPALTQPQRIPGRSQEKPDLCFGGTFHPVQVACLAAASFRHPSSFRPNRELLRFSVGYLRSSSVPPRLFLAPHRKNEKEMNLVVTFSTFFADELGGCSHALT
jgi:hypothetical protein